MSGFFLCCYKEVYEKPQEHLPSDFKEDHSETL